MQPGPGKWLKIHLNKLTQSIAFYPAVIAIGFLLLSWGMLEIDFSSWGKDLKQNLNWLTLKDASTARTIISTVAGAILSLAVFSFSMVMIVLNQAASQMSNRVLGSMIENRFQQVVLGFYIGTIVYALFLLSTIRDINSGVYVPALSIYLLILLTVIDIFLFIYFLDYVTQTVKYETVIHRVQMQAMTAMKANYFPEKPETTGPVFPVSISLKTTESNYFQGYDEKQLLQIARDNSLSVVFTCKAGDFLLAGSPFILVSGNELPSRECLDKIVSTANFYKGQPMKVNPEYGFRQLAEVALKALSPGINDPATAVISLHALADLLAFRLHNRLPGVIADGSGTPRIHVKSSSFEELFITCIHPIWNYGKNDQYIRDELKVMIGQLLRADPDTTDKQLMESFLVKVI